MEKHIIPLRVAKKLKPYLPSGFESKFHWARMKIGIKSKWGKWRIDDRAFIYNGCDLHGESYPAPSFTEILELLPERIEDGNMSRIIFQDYIAYENNNFDTLQFHRFKNMGELAASAAKIYIYLCKEGYIEHSSPTGGTSA